MYRKVSHHCIVNTVITTTIDKVLKYLLIPTYVRTDTNFVYIQDKYLLDRSSSLQNDIYTYISRYIYIVEFEVPYTNSLKFITVFQYLILE